MSLGATSLLTLVSAALALLNVAPVVNAGVYVTSPEPGAAYQAGQSVQVTWNDDGKEPSLSSMGSCSVGLYQGEMQLVQTISTVDVNKENHLTFQVNAAAGPNFDKYYLTFVSTNIDKDGVPLKGFSPSFQLDGMSGGPFPAPTPFQPNPNPNPTQPGSSAADPGSGDGAHTTPATGGTNVPTSTSGNGPPAGNKGPPNNNSSSPTAAPGTPPGSDIPFLASGSPNAGSAIPASGSVFPPQPSGPAGSLANSSNPMGAANASGALPSGSLGANSNSTVTPGSSFPPLSGHMSASTASASPFKAFSGSGSPSASASSADSSSSANPLRSGSSPSPAAGSVALLLAVIPALVALFQ